MVKGYLMCFMQYANPASTEEIFDFVVTQSGASKLLDVHCDPLLN